MEQRNLLLAIVLSVGILIGFQYLFEKMQPPRPPFVSAANVNLANQALELLRLNGTAVAGLALIDSAAGFANAAGVDAISLVPAVAYIHYDATVAPAVDLDQAS